MGLSNWFTYGKETVKNFVKAKLNIPSTPAGKVPTPVFEDYKNKKKKNIKVD